MRIWAALLLLSSALAAAEEPAHTDLLIIRSQDYTLSALEDLKKNELWDWKDREDGSTLKTSASCGVKTETRLLTTRRNHIVQVEITNASDHDLILKPQQIELTDERGAAIDTSTPSEVNPYRLRQGWKAVFALLIPHKRILSNKTKLSVTIPVYANESEVKSSCKIETAHQKNTSIAAVGAQYQTHEDFMLSLSFGSSLIKTGGLAKLSPPIGRSFELIFRAFLSQHGLFLSIAGDGHGSGNGLTFQPVTGRAPTDDPNYDASSFSLGYSYKEFINQKLSLIYDLGISSYTVSYIKGSDYLATSWPHRAVNRAIHQNFTLNYRFLNTPLGQIDAGHYLGFTIYSYWLPHAMLESTINISGVSLGALIGYTFGF